MKTIAIGDIHGRTIWKEIVEQEEADKVVFIGDYFDTHENIPVAQQKQNFEEIIQYKEQNDDKVVLLTGNHDFHYLSEVNERYSGYGARHAKDIENLLIAAIEKDRMQMCYVQNEYIFVHAGFTKTWCRNNVGSDTVNDGAFFMKTVNSMFRSQPKRFAFTPGKNYDVYGDDIEQSPIWVRPASLMKDKPDNYKQVVGHTTQKQIKYHNGIWFIDALGTAKQYLFITDSVAKAKSVSKRRNQ